MWERPEIRILKPSCIDLEKTLQDIDVPLRGMEIALTSCPSFPVAMIKKVNIDDIKMRIGHKLEQLERLTPFYMTKKKGHSLDRSFWPLETISHEDLSASFFLDCLKLLQESTEAIEECKQDTEIQSASGSKNQGISSLKRSWSTLDHIIQTRLLFAFKCSISLGLAVLFGLIYNEKEAS